MTGLEGWLLGTYALGVMAAATVSNDLLELYAERDFPRAVRAVACGFMALMWPLVTVFVLLTVLVELRKWR